MRGHEVGSAGVTLCLVVLVLASIVAVPVDGAVCEDDDGYDLERVGGHWVINGGHNVAVHADGEDWNPPEYVGLDGEWPVGGFTAITIESFVQDPDGGWWVVGDDGHVVRFSENWTFTGEFYEYDGWTGLDGIARLDGQWWVLRDDELVAYNDTWRQGEAFPLDGNHVGLTAADGSLWTITEAGTITEYDVTDGRPVAAASRENVIGRELHQPQGLHRGPDGGWWVLSRGGGIAQYTPAWEHTGYRRGYLRDTPGCGQTDPDDSEWFAAAHLLVVGGGLGWSFRTRQSARTRYARVGLAIASLAIAGVLFNYHLPALFTWLYRLSDVAVSVPLVGGALVTSTMPYLSRDDRNIVDVFVRLTLTTPLWVAGLLF